MNACVPCRLQHVEAERHVLRAQHTQLRHALHRPGNLELLPLYVDVSRYAVSRMFVYVHCSRIRRVNYDIDVIVLAL